MPKFITNFETWLLDCSDRIYRYIDNDRQIEFYEVGGNDDEL